MTVDFQELVQANSYEIAKLDTQDLKNAFAFENVDKNKVKASISREELREFQLIDLSFLKSVNHDGYPKFAVYSLNSENAYFSGRISVMRFSSDIMVHTNFKSQCIRSQFTEICRNLFKKVIANNTVGVGTIINFELTSKFTGILPQGARDKILENKTKFQEIVIIAEAENWTFNQTVTQMPPNPDPLVIGIRDGLAYVICTFDMTKAESYIAREFTEG